MPCLNLSINLSLDASQTDSFISDLSSTLAKLIGKPEAYVMVVVKDGVAIRCSGTKEAAAYGELVAVGSLNPDVNKKLSAGLAEYLETSLNIPKARFFLKFYESPGDFFGWNGSTLL